MGVADELQAERHAVRVAVAGDGHDGQAEQLPGAGEDRGAGGVQASWGGAGGGGGEDRVGPGEEVQYAGAGRASGGECRPVFGFGGLAAAVQECVQVRAQGLGVLRLAA